MALSTNASAIVVSLICKLPGVPVVDALAKFASVPTLATMFVRQSSHETSSVPSESLTLNRAAVTVAP